MHLYEHLFCDELFHRLEERGLHSYIDYQIEALTYHKGFIHLELYVRRELHDEVYALIQTITINIEQSSIDTGLAQLSSEKECVMSGDMDKIHDTLRELNATPWTTVRDFASYDASGVRGAHLPLFATDHTISTHKAKVELILQKDFANSNKHLTPLFYCVAYGMLGDVSDTLQANYAYYVFDNEIVQSGKGLKLQSIFRVIKDYRETPKLLLSKAQEVIERIVEDGSLRRLAVLLRDSEYIYRNPFIDERHIFEATGVLIGDEGWKEIASEANVNLLLQHAYIQVKAGRDTATSSRLRG